MNIGSLCLFCLYLLTNIINSQATSILPIWSGSDLYQTDTITIPNAAKSGNVVYTYKKAFGAGGTMLVCFGYQSMTQTSQGTSFEITMTNGKTKKNNGGTLSYTIGASTNIKSFSVRYLAIDSSVK